MTQDREIPRRPGTRFEKGVYRFPQGGALSRDA